MELTGSGSEFQLGHFLAEMDRSFEVEECVEKCAVSIGPLLSRNG